MADVRLRIQVNPDAESETFYRVTNDGSAVSNVSFKVSSNNTIYGYGDNVNTKGREMLSLANGNLRFTSDGYLSTNGASIGKLSSEDEPDMFVWGAVPSSGEYSVKLTFYGSENLKDIIVYGDPTVNQFPTEAIVDGGTKIYNDENQWIINLGTASETHTIEFTKWNRVNYNACLTQITVMMQYYDVDNKTGLKSVESLSQSTAQSGNIAYNVITNSGSIEVVDINGKIKEMIDNGVVPNSNVQMDIFLNGKQTQSHLSDDSDYFENSLFRVQLKNKLYEWDNVILKGKSYNYTMLYLLLEDVLMSVGYSKEEVSNMLTEKISCVDTVQTVSQYLSKIELSDSNINTFIEECSLREFIEEICSIAQLNVIENDSGEIKFVSARPKFAQENDVIVISSKYISGSPEKTIFNKNTYNNVEFKKNILTYDCQEVFNQNYKIKDDNGNINWKAIEENAEIKTFNGQNFLCFFKSVYGKGNMTRYDYVDNFDKGLHFQFLDKNYNIITQGGTIGYKYLNILKEDYDFSDGSQAVLSPYSDILNETFAFRINIEDVLSQIENIEYVVISISGVVISVSQLDYVYNDNNNKYKFNYYGTLLNDKSYYKANYNYETGGFNKVAMYDVINQNIIDDYSNGINTAKLSSICWDMYDINGNLIKDYSRGEILQVGDIVRVDKDNNGNSRWNYADGSPMYWKITGRNFRYSGVPMLDLELQEVKMA